MRKSACEIISPFMVVPSTILLVLPKRSVYDFGLFSNMIYGFFGVGGVFNVCCGLASNCVGAGSSVSSGLFCIFGAVGFCPFCALFGVFGGIPFCGAFVPGAGVTGAGVAIGSGDGA